MNVQGIEGRKNSTVKSLNIKGSFLLMAGAHQRKKYVTDEI